MRNILAIVGAAGISFLAVGWYLGWYQISGGTGTNGEGSISVKFDTNKAAADIKKGRQIATEEVGNAVEKLRNEQKPGPLTTPGKSTADKHDTDWFGFGAPKR